MRQISIKAETYALKQAFRISRGMKTQAETLIVEISDNGLTGRGEAVPYGRYGETIENASASIEALIPALATGLSRTSLQYAMHPGAARNAVDCALWDLECKVDGVSIYEKLQISAPRSLTTAYTLSLDTAGKMAQAAAAARHFPLLKVKLGAPDGFLGDIDRLQAIRAVIPNHELIIDANEAWSEADLRRHGEALRQFNLTMIEQPLAAGHNHILADFALPFCADESLMDSGDMKQLDPGYLWVNIKLDKAGGLTEALKATAAARAAGLKIMIGCMVGSSLAMAPAVALGQLADLVDLDGPLLLAQDSSPALDYDGHQIHPLAPHHWGGCPNT